MKLSTNVCRIIVKTLPCHKFRVQLQGEPKEEPSVLGGSTGPRKKARPILTSFPIAQNNLAYLPVPVLPPGGDGSALFC